MKQLIATTVGPGCPMGVTIFDRHYRSIAEIPAEVLRSTGGGLDVGAVNAPLTQCEESKLLEGGRS